MMSAAVYLTVAALIAAQVGTRQSRTAIMGVAVFLTMIIGMSRCVLGVHYPTDVLAGWTAGGARRVGAWSAFQSPD
jgi:undecaprenyl-diphosphatase